MVFIANKPVVCLSPYIAARSPHDVDMSCRESLQVFEALVCLVLSYHLHHGMQMVGHDNIFYHVIPFSVIEIKGIGYYFPNLRVSKYARSLAAIKVIVHLSRYDPIESCRSFNIPWFRIMRKEAILHFTEISKLALWERVGESEGDELDFTKLFPV